MPGDSRPPHSCHTVFITGFCSPTAGSLLFRHLQHVQKPASRVLLCWPTAAYGVLGAVRARTSILLCTLKTSLLYRHSSSLCWPAAGREVQGMGLLRLSNVLIWWIPFSEMSMFFQVFILFHSLFSHLSYYYYLNNFPSFSFCFGFFCFIFLCGLAYVPSHFPTELSKGHTVLLHRTGPWGSSGFDLVWTVGDSMLLLLSVSHLLSEW